MPEKFLKRIEVNPAVMLGKPIIKGTRVTVELILRKLSEARPKPMYWMPIRV